MRTNFISRRFIGRLSTILLTILLTIGFSLGACGRKGGLFLPKEAEPESTLSESEASKDSDSTIPSVKETPSNKKDKRQSEAP